MLTLILASVLVVDVFQQCEIKNWSCSCLWRKWHIACWLALLIRFLNICKLQVHVVFKFAIGKKTNQNFFPLPKVLCFPNSVWGRELQFMMRLVFGSLKSMTILYSGFSIAIVFFLFSWTLLSLPWMTRWSFCRILELVGNSFSYGFCKLVIVWSLEPFSCLSCWRANVNFVSFRQTPHLYVSS